MNRTAISWCTHTVNPIRANGRQGHRGHYCEKVSPGCKNCYASAMQRRFGMPEFAEQRREGVEVFLDTAVLQGVLRARATDAILFWCDMTDAFGSWVPDEWLDQILAVCALTPQITHVIVTKRAEQMREYFSRHDTGLRWAKAAREMMPTASHQTNRKIPKLTPEQAVAWARGLPNLLLGISAENQAQLDARAPYLAQLAAEGWRTFWSLEPILERMYLQPHLGSRRPELAIIGGESGHRYRDCGVQTILDAVEECLAAGVPVHCKQDCAVRPGQQGRIPEAVWRLKALPERR